ILPAAASSVGGIGGVAAVERAELYRVIAGAARNVGAHVVAAGLGRRLPTTRVGVRPVLRQSDTNAVWECAIVSTMRAVEGHWRARGALPAELISSVDGDAADVAFHAVLGSTERALTRLLVRHASAVAPPRCEDAVGVDTEVGLEFVDDCVAPGKVGVVRIGPTTAALAVTHPGTDPATHHLPVGGAEERVAAGEREQVVVVVGVHPHVVVVECVPCDDQLV